MNTYTEQEQRRLFVDEDDGAKVAAIAQKIKELTQNTSDPVMRDRVLSESKVKYNNQIMSLKEFLALCGQGVDVEDQNYIDGGDNIPPEEYDQEDDQED